MGMGMGMGYSSLHFSISRNPEHWSGTFYRYAEGDGEPRPNVPAMALC